MAIFPSAYYAVYKIPMAEKYQMIWLMRVGLYFLLHKDGVFRILALLLIYVCYVFLWQLVDFCLPYHENYQDVYLEINGEGCNKGARRKYGKPINRHEFLQKLKSMQFCEHVGIFCLLLIDHSFRRQYNHSIANNYRDRLIYRLVTKIRKFVWGYNRAAYWTPYKSRAVGRSSAANSFLIYTYIIAQNWRY